jgi:hypothetical protein
MQSGQSIKAGFITSVHNGRSGSKKVRANIQRG